MYGFTVPMALVDYIPVVFFGVAALLLQKDLHNKMSRNAFVLFAAGFLLAGAGIIGMLARRKNVLLAAPPVFGGSAVFIMMMVLGLGAMSGQDSTLAWVNWTERPSTASVRACCCGALPSCTGLT